MFYHLKTHHNIIFPSLDLRVAAHKKGCSYMLGIEDGCYIKCSYKKRMCRAIDLVRILLNKVNKVM